MKLSALLLLCWALSAPGWAASHVNILVYHHVSETTPASTSVSPDQFRKHLQLLKDQGFTVVPLADALTVLSGSNNLPEKAIAITFDDGFANIYQNAYPILKEFNYPFTVFVATDSIDEHYPNMMSWDQLRELQNGGVTIANHSADHGYLVRYRKHDRTWRAAIRNNIERAQARLNAELDSEVPNWFAYPYGEFSKDLTALLKEMGYIGFAQHSGGLWSGSNPQAIPRFAAAGIYASVKTLLTKLNSQPMPINETTLADMLTTSTEPVLQADLLTLADQSKVLNCFVDGEWTQATHPSEQHFQVRSPNPLGEGRHRYNCTTQSLTGDFYYWFSKSWLVYPEYEGH